MWKLVKKGTRSPVLSTSETLTGIEAEQHQLIEMLNEAFPGIVSANDFEVIQSADNTLDSQRSVVLEKMHDVAVAMDYDAQDAVQLHKKELHDAVAEYRKLGADDNDMVDLCQAYIDRYGWRR